MSETNIVVQKREQLGKNANRRLRAGGEIPAVLYGGKKKDAVAIKVPRRNVLELLRQEGGENAVFLLQLEGTKSSRHAMIHEMQLNPATHEILHIDFQRIEMDEVVRIQVPVELVGVAAGVKNEGGLTDFVTRELHVECLPKDIPPSIPAHIEALHIGQHLEAGDLEMPEGVTLLEDAERVIVSIAAPRLAAVEEEEAEELLEAEAEEPEVIGRGKAEEEEGDEE